jgi:hypothetical protein
LVEEAGIPSEWMATIGVPAAVVIIILREVFGFVKVQKNGKDKELLTRECRTNLKEVINLTKELHAMHAVYDEDHVPVWHNRKSMIRDLSKMRENSEEQVRLLTRLVEEMERRNR